MAAPAEATATVHAPIAPGMVRSIDIAEWELMRAGQAFTPTCEAGSIALDGERELSFAPHDRVSVQLLENAFKTVDVSACMRYAARHGLLSALVNVSVDSDGQQEDNHEEEQT